jgi:formamidopyrimidine-DNA glycosylase
MPELPEVETIKRGLEKKIVGLQITDIQILNPKTFQGDVGLVASGVVRNVWRRAKVLGVDLDRVSLLFHLKMSGQLIWVGKTKFIGGHPTLDMIGQMPNKSTRVIFIFSDGSQLYFNDQRKFGWVRVSEKEKLKNEKFFATLGPEPLEKEFTWQVVQQRLGKRKNMPVKVALMDQQLIAGIGNIYASEALFNAAIDPRRKVSSFTEDEFKKLHQGIVKALNDGIKRGGSSKTTFVNAAGEKGLFLDYAFVYQRAKKQCKNCQGMIVQFKQAGRSTFFCPTCQK